MCDAGKYGMISSENVSDLLPKSFSMAWPQHLETPPMEFLPVAWHNSFGVERIGKRLHLGACLPNECLDRVLMLYRREDHRATG
jgi:hypothetical protein